MSIRHHMDGGPSVKICLQLTAKLLCCCQLYGCKSSVEIRLHFTFPLEK